MKNKFLLFSLLFVLALLILIYPQSSFAAISVETLDASAGLTSATLNSTTTADETYDKRGFNLGTNLGDYNIGTSTQTGGPWGPSAEESYSTTTNDTWGNLSKGECYYFRAYVSSSTDATKLTYGGEKKFLTGLDEPANLAKTAAAQTSISLSWTTTTGAHAVNVIVRYGTDQYPTDIESGTLGCKINGTSCAVSSLSCGTAYYFRAWASTTDGGLSTTSDSYSELTGSTSDCPTVPITGRACVPPNVFTDSLVINQGAEYSQTREVELSIKADSALYMSICNNNLFYDGCILESYSTTKSWTLTEGDGEKTVYAVFVSDCGANSVIVFDTIILKTEVPEEIVEEAPEEISEEVVEEVPEEVVEEEVAEEAVEKPISEMTIEELKAKIAEIMAQIEGLQAQLAELEEVVPIAFEVNLGYGNRGAEVVKLQEILIKEGLLTEGLNTGYFGPLTKEAVIKFQEKYAEDILTPLGLTAGTGFVGEKTRAELNEILGK